MVGGDGVQRAQWSPGPSVRTLFFLLLDEYAVQTQQHLDYTLIFHGGFCELLVFEFLYSFVHLLFQKIFIK